MGNRVNKLLFDILTSIKNIDNYIGENRVYELYDNNPMLQDAVERNIEIIGEAISNSRRIVDARNKIIHGYDEIENVQIWGIIINHLPKLKEEVEVLLDNENL